jgi:hypothetical protein
MTGAGASAPALCLLARGKLLAAAAALFTDRAGRPGHPSGSRAAQALVKGRGPRRLVAPLALAVALSVAASPAQAAGAPQIPAAWVTDVTATSANLRAQINANGLATTYRFEYIAEAAYQANLQASPPRAGFAGAAKAPPSGAAPIGAGTTPLSVFQHLGSLAPLTAYRYRPVATNSAGPTTGPEHILATEAPSNVFALPDERAWELVSPVDKGGGSVAAPGALFGGGDFQAAVGGGALTYSSATAFGAAAGAPPASQYISRRSAAGWSTEDISAPLESGGYGDEPDGVPYRVFSADLARALMGDPRRCESGPCPRGYSLRDNASGAFAPLPAQAAGMRVLSASPDLARILFEDAGGEVYEWSGGGLVPSQAPPEPEPVGGIVGVLGASASGEIVYYQDANGLKRWRNGAVTTIVAGADAAAPSDWPQATGTARVSADGLHLAFLSAAAIPPFDNTDANTGEPDTELYLYDAAGAGALICASCNPTGERPQGSASIPGAQPNGTTTLYKPRALSADGRRLFFDSADKLAIADTDSRPDVYEWEAFGEGDCARAPGCLGLLSGGRGEGGAFLDASADGADAYFLSGESLVPADPGSIDAYDARVGGGLPEAQKPIPCVGDACQALPSPPDDPTPGTLVPNSGNPPLAIVKEKPKRKHHKKKRHRRHHRHRVRRRR